jgi:enterochelin esterase-like enzyme
MPLDSATAAADRMTSHTVVTAGGVDFVLADAPGRTGVRLEVDWDLGSTDPEFQLLGGAWRLYLPRPAADRFEYQFTVRSRGHTEWVTDPGNTETVPNPFGDKSEIRFPDYRPPEWLDGPESGVLQSIATTQGDLEVPVPVTLWAPDRLAPETVAPLLLANDGTDMAIRGSMLRWATWAAADRPFRIAMLDPAPGYRDRWYAALPGYADHLAAVVVPAIRNTVAVGGTIGLGASLGALSMLAAQRRHPDLLDALMLQSGSFFTSALDSQESGYGQFGQVCAAVADIAGRPAGRTCSVRITCGTVEENRGNNERMAETLTAQDYQVKLRLVPDAHTMIGWRDAWSPDLEELLDTVS